MGHRETLQSQFTEGSLARFLAPSQPPERKVENPSFLFKAETENKVHEKPLKSFSDEANHPFTIFNASIVNVLAKSGGIRSEMDAEGRAIGIGSLLTSLLVAFGLAAVLYLFANGNYIAGTIGALVLALLVALAFFATYRASYRAYNSDHR